VGLQAVFKLSSSRLVILYIEYDITPDIGYDIVTDIGYDIVPDIGCEITLAHMEPFSSSHETFLQLTWKLSPVPS
jgi:hypothetical protein